MTRLSDDSPKSAPASSTEGDDDSRLDELRDDVAEAVRWPARAWRTARAAASRWRARMHANPVTRVVYKTVVLVVGAAITVVGLFLVPLPGPGWAIVFVGLWVMATESKIARRILDFGKDLLEKWTEWLKRQSLTVKALISLATAVFVACVVWAVAAYYGVPGWIPESWVPPLPGLD